MLTPVSIFVVAVVLARVVYPLSMRWAWRLALGVPVVVLAFHYRILGRFFGGMNETMLPSWSLAVLATGFIALLLLAVAVLALDLAGLMAWICRARRVRALLAAPWLRPGMAVCALLLSTWGTWQAMRVPPVREIPVSVAGLPEAFEGYRVLQLTDLHTSSLLTGDWLAAVVARANAQQADLIVITGDLVDGQVQRRRADVRPLAGLHAPDGVLMVTGNHEYYSQYRAWMEAFRQMPVTVLENSHVRIQRGGAALTVAGLTDRVATRYGLPEPDIRAALSGADPAAPVLLLDHRPGAAPDNAAHDVALQLSGHTHGGHILGMHRLVARANNGFVSGLYDVDGMQLYVSNGAGLWAGFATRIGVPSEITVLRLHRARD